jgi:putative nucleotidyltransferase-like protein
VDEFPERDVLVRRITSFDLPGQDDDPPWAVSDQVWPFVLGTLTREKLVGLAVAAVEDGSLILSQQQTSKLAHAHVDSMTVALQIERSLMEIADALESDDVEFIVLKGPALAHRIYPEPCWRPFGDLDILVHTRDWRRACGIFEELGFARALPEPRAGFDERFGKASVHRRNGDPEIDLHRTLVLGPFGLWMEPERLFDRTETFSIGGRALRRLDDTSLMLHACIHASLGWFPPLQLPLRDAAQTAWHADVDWDDLADIARRWRLTAVVQHTFRTVSSNLRVRLPEGTQQLFVDKPMRTELRALSSYTTDRRKRGGTARATLQAIPGLRRKVAYVLMMLFPRREFLSARLQGGPKGSYLKRLMIPFRWFRSLAKTGMRRKG